MTCEILRGLAHDIHSAVESAENLLYDVKVISCLIIHAKQKLNLCHVQLFALRQEEESLSPSIYYTAKSSPVTAARCVISSYFKVFTLLTRI